MVYGICMLVGLLLFVGIGIFFLVAGGGFSRSFKLLAMYAGLVLAGLVIFSLGEQLFAQNLLLPIGGFILSPIAAAIATALKCGVGKNYVDAALKKFPPDPSL